MSARHHFESCASTNDEAMRLLRQGAAHGTIVTADTQTAGRGRAGRSWYSPANGSVYLSVIWRPSLPVEALPQVTLQAALAVARTVEALTGRTPRLKWPNDVLLDGGKCAGILTELKAEPPAAVVVGIGLDAAELPADAPDEIRAVARSIGVDRDRAIEALTTALAAAFADLEGRGGFDRASWCALSDTLGQPVTVTPPGEAPFDAVAVDVAPSGRLIVERDGRREEVVAGDVEAR